MSKCINNQAKKEVMSCVEKINGLLNIAFEIFPQSCGVAFLLRPITFNVYGEVYAPGLSLYIYILEK